MTRNRLARELVETRDAFVGNNGNLGGRRTRENDAERGEQDRLRVLAGARCRRVVDRLPLLEESPELFPVPGERAVRPADP